VNLMNTKPRVKVTVERAESDVHVQMENEVESPLAFWFAKVYEKNGGLLAMQIGETLPAALDFKLASADSTDPWNSSLPARTDTATESGRRWMTS